MISDDGWDPAQYARHARFVPELGRPLITLLAPAPGERILDLGCGEGLLAAELARLGGQVTAVDSSLAQLRACRRRGLTSCRADGHDLPFAAAFDAVFSNAALHWMLEPRRVLRSVGRVLRPGGRFVAEMGAEGNIDQIWSSIAGALRRRHVDGTAAKPWYFPSESGYRGLLEEHGFRVEQIYAFPRPTDIGRDARGWLEVMGRPFLRLLPPAEQPAFVADVAQELRAKLDDGQGNLVADYVRLRFRAVKLTGPASPTARQA